MAVATVALIQPLAWEFTYFWGVALKSTDACTHTDTHRHTHTHTHTHTERERKHQHTEEIKKKERQNNKSRVLILDSDSDSFLTKRIEVEGRDSLEENRQQCY